MSSVIFTPLLAQTNLAVAIALGLAVGIAVGALATYIALISYRKRYLAAEQQLANLQSQNTPKRPANPGIPQSQSGPSATSAAKLGLPPKINKPKPQTTEPDPKFEQQIQLLTEQNASLQSQLETERQRFGEIREQHDQLKKTVDERAAKASSETPSDQQWQINQLHAENIQLQTTLDQYREQLEQIMASPNAEHVRQLEMEKSHLENQLRELTEKLESPRESHSTSPDSVDVAEFDALRTENESLKIQLDELASANSDSEQRAEDLRALEEQLRDAQLQLEQSEQSTAHLQAQVSEYEANIKSLEHRIEESASGKESATESLEELRMVLAQSEAAVASLEREKLDYKTQLDELQHRMASDAALLSETSEATVEENEANRKLIKSLNEELAQRDEQLLAVQKNINDLYIARDRVASLEIAMAERNSTIERMESELGDLRVAAAQAIDATEFDALQESLERQQSEAGQAKARAAEVVAALESAQKELEIERQRFHDETERTQQLQTELQNSQGLQEQLESEARQLREQLEHTSAELTAERTNVPAHVNEQLEALRNELAAREEAINAGKGKIDELTQVVTQLQSELELEKSNTPDSVKQQMEELRLGLEDRTTAITEATDERNHYRDELDQVRTEKEQANKQIAELEEQINALRTSQSEESKAGALRFAELTQTIEQLTNELEIERTRTPETVERHVSELQQQLEQRTAFSDQTSSELSELRDNLEHLQLEQQQIERERDDAISAAAEAEETTTATIDDLNEQLRNLKSEFDRAVADRDQAYRKIEDLAEQVQGSHSAQSEIAALQQQVMSLISEKEKHRAACDEAEDRIDELEAELAVANESLASSDSSAAEKVSDAKLEVEQLKTTCLKFQADAESASHELNHAHAQLAEMQATSELFETVKLELNGKAKTLEERIRSLEVEITKRDHAIKSLKTENESSSSRLEQLVDAEKELEETRKLLDESNSRRTQLQTSIETAHEKIQELQDEIATRDLAESGAAAHAESELEDLRRENSRLESQLNDLNLRAQAAESQNFDASALHEELSNLRKQLSDREQQCNEAKKQIIDLQREISEQEAGVSRIESEATERQLQLERENTELKLQVDRLAQRIEVLQAQSDESDRNDSDLADRDRQIEELNVSVENTSQQLGLLQTQFEKANESNTQLQTKVDELTALLAEKRTENQSLIGQIAADQRAISQLTTRLEKSQALAEKAAGDSSETEKLLQEIEMLNGKLDERDKLVEATEKELLIQQSAHEKAKRQLESIERATTSNQDKLKAAIAKIKELESAAAEQTGEPDSESQKKIEQLQAQVADYEEEQSLLVSELRNLRERSDELAKQLLLAEAQKESAAGAQQREDAEQTKADTKKSTLKRQIKELQSELEATKEELFHQSESANSWRKERSSLLNQIESLTQQADGAKEMLARVEKTSGIDDLSSIVGRNDQLEKELKQTAQRLEERDDKLAEIVATLAASRREVSTLESKLSHAEAVLRNRAENANNDYAAPVPTNKKKAKAVKNKQSNRTKEKTKVRSASQQKTLGFSRSGDRLDPEYQDRPKNPDNLREINGLGPKFEKKLNELGIYHYSQIANWDSKTAAEVSERIGAGPRVKKDKWIQQAKKLAKENR